MTRPPAPSACYAADPVTPMWSISRLPSAHGSSATCMSSPLIQTICGQSMTPSSGACHEVTVRVLRLTGAIRSTGRRPWVNPAGEDSSLMAGRGTWPWHRKAHAKQFR